VLRFTGLGWGLRHPPHADERVFVENVLGMAERGDLDHRYYEYPGLFFHLLRPALALTPDGGARAYLLARGVVAAFGVLGCGLAYLLGRALAGPAVGLLGALLLAVSPVAVHTAHMVRPDVVLQVFVTAALLALLRVGERRGRDAAAGAWIGLATAVKFSGAFLVPSYLLRRALAPGARLPGALLAGAAALAAFLLTTPYAAIHAREFLAGVQTQVGYHYDESDGLAAGLGLAPAYVLVWPRALGLPAAVLAAAGAILALRSDARRWLPLMLLPLATLVVMASQRFLFARHLLPSLAVPALLAALAVQALAAVASRRLRAPPAVIAAGLGLAVAAAPLRTSLYYARAIARPGTRDRALDWADLNLPAQARVLSTVERFGLDAGRLEVIESPALGPHDGPLVLEMDHVLATTADDARALEGLAEQARFEPDSAVSGPTIRALSVPPSLRPAYRLLPLAPGQLTASENGGDIAAAADGRVETLWRTADPQRIGDWVAAALPEPVRLGRVELWLGPHTRFAARELQLAVSSDGATWMDVRTRPTRPAVDHQQPSLGPSTQTLVLVPPVTARYVRVGLRRSGAHRWGIAELRLYAL
jgi:4-amino-4-deoxy-L-arabinose transferase-like glycosyltransferase